MTRRVLILQHMDNDRAGRFEDFLSSDGFAIDTVLLHRGAPLPSLKSYDFMLVLGGAMDVWQEAEYPWLVAEKAAIREWVLSRARPFLGICLGHQLLASALGGKVAMAAREEIGVYEVALTPHGMSHHLFAGLPVTMQTTQWHHAEVSGLPEGAVVLASTPATAVQAMAVGDCALGLQFHAEWTSEFIGYWQALPSYVGAMEKALGVGAYVKFAAAASAIMPAYQTLGRRLYQNLVRSAGRPTKADDFSLAQLKQYETPALPE